MSNAVFLTDSAGNVWQFTTDVNGVLQSSLATTGIPGVQPGPPVGQVAVGKLIKRVQVLLDDPSGKRYDDQYVSNFIAQCNDDMVVEFAAMGVEYGEQVVQLPNLAPGTTDLVNYQLPGSILEFMILPIALEWKHAGSPIFEYIPIRRVDKVVDTQSVDGISSWSPLSGVVQLSPSTSYVDLRIRFFGMPMMGDPPDPISDNIMRSMLTAMTYRVAGEIVGSNTGTEGEVLIERFEKKEHRSKENIEELITKQDQSTRRVLGRYNRGNRGGPAWRIPTV